MQAQEVRSGDWSTVQEKDQKTKRQKGLSFGLYFFHLDPAGVFLTHHRRDMEMLRALGRKMGWGLHFTMTCDKYVFRW